MLYMKYFLAIVLMAAGLLVITAAFSFADHPAAGIYESTIRAKGFACGRIERIDPLVGKNRPGESNWFVTCDRKRYQVTFIEGADQRVRLLN
jgi:hypothetical protein